MAITRAVAKIVETIGDTIRRLAILRLSRVYSIHFRLSPRRNASLASVFGIQSRVDNFRLTNTRERERERERERFLRLMRPYRKGRLVVRNWLAPVHPF